MWGVLGEPAVLHQKSLIGRTQLLLKRSRSIEGNLARTSRPSFPELSRTTRRWASKKMLLWIRSGKHVRFGIADISLSCFPTQQTTMSCQSSFFHVVIGCGFFLCCRLLLHSFATAKGCINSSSALEQSEENSLHCKYKLLSVTTSQLCDGRFCLSGLTPPCFSVITKSYISLISACVHQLC